jgi:hypothetical protein
MEQREQEDRVIAAIVQCLIDIGPEWGEVRDVHTGYRVEIWCGKHRLCGMWVFDDPTSGQIGIGVDDHMVLGTSWELDLSDPECWEKTWKRVHLAKQMVEVSYGLQSY